MGGGMWVECGVEWRTLRVEGSIRNNIPQCAKRGVRNNTPGGVLLHPQIENARCVCVCVCGGGGAVRQRGAQACWLFDDVLLSLVVPVVLQLNYQLPSFVPARQGILGQHI